MAYIYFYTMRDTWTNNVIQISCAYSNLDKCVDEVYKNMEQIQIENDNIVDNMNELKPEEKINLYTDKKIVKHIPTTSQIKQLNKEKIITEYASWKLIKYDINAHKRHGYDIDITRLRLE